MTDENTRRMVEEAAKLAAREAVHDTLTTLGLDVSDPLEVQKDMAALRDMRLLLKNPDFQADLQQIRALRTSGNFIKTKTGGAIITLVVGGVCGLIWLAFKDVLGIGG